MNEFEAGPGQLIVTYWTNDTGAHVEPEGMASGMAADAARRAADGWRIVSQSTFALRQMGTAGNILLQSGGQFATQLAAIVVYARSV